MYLLLNLKQSCGCTEWEGGGEHLKYKLQNAKYKIQNTKYKVLWLCGVEKGGCNATNGLHGKEPPHWQPGWAFEIQIQRSRQWTKHTSTPSERTTYFTSWYFCIFICLSLFCSVLYLLTFSLCLHCQLDWVLGWHVQHFLIIFQTLPCVTNGRFIQVHNFWNLHPDK